MNESEQPEREILKPAQWLLLLSGLLLYLVLRLPWVGHLLTWDEAMNVCSARAFAAGGQDYFSEWFWRRPPLYGLLLLLAQPLRAGFALRADIVSIGIGVAGFLALFLLNRRVFGTAAALWSIFFLSVMPAAMFFDVWIKQDGLANLFGLIALLMFVERRHLACGICLGLGLLSKEVVIFYGMAVGILWLLQPAADRTPRSLATVVVIPVLLAGWWFVWFSNSVSLVVKFLTDSKGFETGEWARPWHYYFDKLHVDLGWYGVGLLAVGVLSLFALWRRSRKSDAATQSLLWPAALLVPSYILLTLIKGKTFWFTAILLPALVTVQAVGAQSLVELFGRLGDRFRVKRYVSAGGAALVLVVLFLCAAAGKTYEGLLKEQDEGYWRASTASREAALMLNRLAAEGERALITPMFYWNTPAEKPCPIFVCYLKDIPVVVRKYEITFDALVEDIREYKIDWVMISPDPSVSTKTLVEPFRKEFGLLPMKLQGCLIYHTSGIHSPQPRRRR